MDRAVTILGDNLAKNSQGYLGPHGHVLTFPIDHGKLLNIVAFASASKWDSDKWVIHTNPHEVQNDFEGWGNPVSGIVKVILMYTKGLLT